MAGKAPFNPFRGVLRQGDMIDNDSVLSTTAFTEIGRYVVPAGVGISIGYGRDAGQDNAPGRIYCDINKVGPADVDGIIRFVVIDPREMVVETLFECHTTQLRTSATDRTQQLPFPEHDAILTEDYILSMQMKGDTADTLDASICVLTMDVTTYTMK